MKFLLSAVQFLLSHVCLLVTDVSGRRITYKKGQASVPHGFRTCGPTVLVDNSQALAHAVRVIGT